MALYFPILEEAVQTDRLDISEFIDLLREEERYFKGEEHNTKLMITRLRKIFFDKYGWDKQLIRRAASIEGRYQVSLREDSDDSYLTEGLRIKTRHFDEKGVKHLHRVVTVKKGDWLNPDAGSVPEIYKNNHQEVILRNNWICDMGHVLAGMDALNYPAPVSPLPDALLFLKRLFPLVDNNADAATWLGDMSSISGEFLFEEKKTGNVLNEQQKQKLIDICSSAADNLGNIDSFVIGKTYPINSHNGMRVTDILTDYYLDNGLGSHERYMAERIKVNCYAMGLEKWNGDCFENENEWVSFYSKELRTTTAFYTFTRYSKSLRRWFIALKTWMGINDRYLNLNLLLKLYIQALKSIITKYQLKTNEQLWA